MLNENMREICVRGINFPKKTELNKFIYKTPYKIIYVVCLRENRRVDMITMKIYHVAELKMMITTSYRRYCFRFLMQNYDIIY